MTEPAPRLGGDAIEALDTPPRWSVAAARGWADRNRFGLAVFGLCWIILLFAWAAYFPGLFSPDSLDYIRQVTTSDWDTHHSVLYDAIVWLSLYGTGGVATLTLLQTVAISAGLAYIATGLRRLGGPGWLLAVAAAGMLLMPSVASFSVCVWKDVGFVIGNLFALGTLIGLLHRRMTGDDTRVPARTWWVLGVELLVISLMRPNGFAIVTGAGIVFWLILRGVYWRVATIAAAAGALALIATVAIFPALGVKNVFTETSSGPTIGDIAVIYAEHPSEFTTADLALMRSAAPLSLWVSTANCRASNTIVTPGFDADVANSHFGEFSSLWQRLLRDDPGAVVGARLCRATVAWLPYERTRADALAGTPTVGYTALMDDAFRTSPFVDAVYARPLIPGSRGLIHDWGQVLNHRVLEPLQWRGSFWCYVSYIAIIVAALRRRSALWLSLAALPLANQLVVLLQTPVPSARYMFAPLMMGPLLACVAFVTRRTPSPSGDPDTAEAQPVTRAGTSQNRA